MPRYPLAAAPERVLTFEEAMRRFCAEYARIWLENHLGEDVNDAPEGGARG